MLPDTFHTAHLDLRLIASDDAGPIFATYAQDDEVPRFLTWQPHRSLNQTVDYIAHCIATPSHIARTYVLITRENGAIRGALELRWTAPHRLDVGYVLGRTWWRQGLMTEALGAAVGWAMSQSSVFRIGAVCDVDNIASMRVMEKAGMTCEGVLRRWVVHPNVSSEPRDCFSYACVR